MGVRSTCRFRKTSRTRDRGPRSAAGRAGLPPIRRLPAEIPSLGCGWPAATCARRPRDVAPRTLLKVISAMATACLLAPSTAHGQVGDAGGGLPAVRRVSLEEALRRLAASNLELR